MKKFTTRQKKSEKTSKKKSKNKWNKQATQNSMKKFTTAPGGDRHGGSEVELQEPMKMLTWSPSMLMWSPRTGLPICRSHFAQGQSVGMSSAADSP